MDFKKVAGFIAVLAVGVGLAVYRGQANKAVEAKAAVTADQVSECCHNCPSYAKNEAFFDRIRRRSSRTGLQRSLSTLGPATLGQVRRSGVLPLFFQGPDPPRRDEE